MLPIIILLFTTLVVALLWVDFVQRRRRKEKERKMALYNKTIKSIRAIEDVIRTVSSFPFPPKALMILYIRLARYYNQAKTIHPEKHNFSESENNIRAQIARYANEEESNSLPKVSNEKDALLITSSLKDARSFLKDELNAPALTQSDILQQIKKIDFLNLYVRISQTIRMGENSLGLGHTIAAKERFSFARATLTESSEKINHPWVVSSINYCEEKLSDIKNKLQAKESIKLKSDEVEGDENGLDRYMDTTKSKVSANY